MRDCILLHVFSIFENGVGKCSRYMKVNLMFVPVLCLERPWMGASDSEREGKPFICKASYFNFR